MKRLIQRFRAVTNDYVVLGAFSGIWAALCGWALFFLSEELTQAHAITFWIVFGATAVAATVLEVYRDLFKEGYTGLPRRIPGLFVGTLVVAATLEVFIMAMHALADIASDSKRRHDLLESIFKPQSEAGLLGYDAVVFFVWWTLLAILFSVAAHYATAKLLRHVRFSRACLGAIGVACALILLYLFAYRWIQVYRQWNEVHTIVHLKLTDLHSNSNFWMQLIAYVSSVTEWVMFHSGWWYKAAFTVVIFGLVVAVFKIKRYQVARWLALASVGLALFVPSDLDQWLHSARSQLASVAFLGRGLDALLWFIDRAMFHWSFWITALLIMTLLFALIAVGRKASTLVAYIFMAMIAGLVLFVGIAMMPLFLNGWSLFWFLCHSLGMWVLLTAAVTLAIPLMRNPETRAHGRWCAGLSAAAALGIILYSASSGVLWVLPAAGLLFLFAVVFIKTPRPSRGSWSIVALTLATIMGLASSTTERLVPNTVMSELHALNALPAVDPRPPQATVLRADAKLSDANRLTQVHAPSIETLDREVHALDTLKTNYIERSVTIPSQKNASLQAFRVATGVQQKLEAAVEEHRSTGETDSSAPRRLIASLTAALTFWITASLMLLMTQAEPRTQEGLPGNVATDENAPPKSAPPQPKQAPTKVRSDIAPPQRASEDPLPRL
jgi:hypothetical protein